MLKPNLLRYLLSLYLAAGLCPAIAQTKQTTKTKQKTTTVNGGGGGVIVGSANAVAMSLDGHTFQGVLPFDVPFNLTCTPGTTDAVKFDQVTGLECWFDVRKNWSDMEDVKVNPEKYLTNHVSGNVDPTLKQFTISIPELKHSTNYYFVFKVKRKLSDAQRTALINALKPEVADAILKASDNGKNQVTDEQFDELLTDIEGNAADALAANAIKINFSGLLPANQKKMQAALQNIADVYGPVTAHRDEIDHEIVLLRQSNTQLRDFEDKYELHIKDPAADPKVIALKALFPLFPPLFGYPDKADALDPVQVTAYLANCKALNDAVKAIALPDSAGFKPLQKNLLDYSEGLFARFKRYTDEYKDAQTAMANEVSAFVDAMSGQLYSVSFVNGTSTPGVFLTRSNLYISADLGVALIPDLGLAAPYMGTNIYLRPVNKDHPLRSWQLDERFSFLVGISVTTLAKTNYRYDLLGGTFNLITGAGFRVFDFVRFNGGVAWYGEHDRNPLNSNQTLGRSWFVSVSFDIDVKTVFSPLFDASKTTMIH